ncbi:MAG: sigma-70 family RNA polymerase sigma factor [Phycisphaerales bacterium]|nr:sigma-70 family RNA polymerase sigma factor [Phycisphaerales bacterium]
MAIGIGLAPAPSALFPALYAFQVQSLRPLYLNGIGKGFNQRVDHALQALSLRFRPAPAELLLLFPIDQQMELAGEPLRISQWLVFIDALDDLDPKCIGSHCHHGGWLGVRGFDANFDLATDRAHGRSWRLGCASTKMFVMADAQVTRILSDLAAGRRESAGELLPLVYQQLRAIAQQRMNQERGGHTLQATALVHEAYLRLVGDGETRWDHRGHFFAAAAEAMRRILIEHARARSRHKRGGPQSRRLEMRVEDVADLAACENPQQVIALDDAFCRLQREEPRAADVVRLRFYAGMSVDDTAKVLGVSPRTVDLDWSFARAWLYRALQEQP